MCALHHRPFDANVLRVKPDYRIEPGEVRLEKTDDAAEQNLTRYRGEKL